MLFSDNIPEEVLRNPDSAKFLSVLDGLQEFRQIKIAEYLRANNSAVCTDKTVLLRYLLDYGVTLPYGLPVIILQQFLLNVDTLMAYKGSRLGIILLCSVLSLGEVTLDETHFGLKSQLLYPDDLDKYITGDNNNGYWYLCSDSDEISPQSTLDITIESLYADGDHAEELAVIEQTIRDLIEDFVGFYKTEVTITWQSRASLYFNEHLNSYFV